MKSGVEYIAEERQNQIAKGFNIETDRVKYKPGGELKIVAGYCIKRADQLALQKSIIDSGPFPWGDHWKNKIDAKNPIQLFAIAGALLIADIDLQVPGTPGYDVNKNQKDIKACADAIDKLTGYESPCKKSASNAPACTVHDPVNHPKHYTDGKYEVIDFIADKKFGFHVGNAVKYISRAGKKDPAKKVEDLEKAQWYVADLQQRELENPSEWPLTYTRGKISPQDYVADKNLPFELARTIECLCSPGYHSLNEAFAYLTRAIAQAKKALPLLLVLFCLVACKEDYVEPLHVGERYIIQSDRHTADVRIDAIYPKGFIIGGEPLTETWIGYKWASGKYATTGARFSRTEQQFREMIVRRIIGKPYVDSIIGHKSIFDHNDTVMGYQSFPDTVDYRVLIAQDSSIHMNAGRTQYPKTKLAKTKLAKTRWKTKVLSKGLKDTIPKYNVATSSKALSYIGAYYIDSVSSYAIKSTYDTLQCVVAICNMPTRDGLFYGSVLITSGFVVKRKNVYGSWPVKFLDNTKTEEIKNTFPYPAWYKLIK